MIHPASVNIANLVIAEFDPRVSLTLMKGTFPIETCQRTVVLGFDLPEYDSYFASARRTFDGVEAYEYLLRFACGLESEIKGETDVFGQVKNAFKHLQSNEPALADQWTPLFTKLFEDTKEIRAQYLQGIGGNTYGALARRLMSPHLHDQILIIGAGDLSKSISPYFAEFPLTIWNRSLSRLNLLTDELSKKGFHPDLSVSEFDLPELISKATLILMTVPFGSPLDALVERHHTQHSRVLHLGAQSSETQKLNFVCYSLTDLFEMEKEQDQLRSKQVRTAIQACHERALLRNLSKSIHIAHGWEDLAVFL